MTTARILDCTDEEYFADPLPTPSLSQSVAHTLLAKSPYHAWLQHPKLGGVGRAPTKSQDNGSLVHALLLGVGKEIAIIDAADFRSKAAREERDAARTNGRIPVLQHEAADAMLVVADIKLGLTELGITLAGVSEIKVAWSEETSLGPVLCRGMLDHVIVDRGVIFDVKTCKSAHPRACTSHIIEYGYHLQSAAYSSWLRKFRPELAGRESFTFLFVEELPEGSPRRVVITPVALNGQFRALGERRWARACETWAHCVQSNTWSGYADRVLKLDAPKWALANEMEEAS
jgi:hypothetical protein